MTYSTVPELRSHFLPGVLIALTILTAVLGQAPTAQADSRIAQGTASSAAGTFLVTPGGQGERLDDLGLTVTVYVYDEIDNVPVPGYPFQDVYLDDSGDGSLAVCLGGSAANANTNIDGITTIVGPVYGGGYSEDGVQVYIAGNPAETPPLPLKFVSPDLNADLDVDLGDVGEFAIDFVAGSGFRADLNHDGLLNLADLGILAMSLGESCP